ncbi:MAG TPA: hypothetical protein VE978_01410 [Chitinophagales bacterium]|nr:hypothetical protein [Chitinophagales bacterium]
MENLQSQQKYLEVLMMLNNIRRGIYLKMTRALDTRLKKLFSKFSMDSMANVNALEEVLPRHSGSFSSHYSFQPDSLLQSLGEGAEDIFDRCREAEWRLLHFYEEIIENPKTTDEVRSILIPQRDKVLSGYEHLNLLCRNPW